MIDDIERFRANMQSLRTLLASPSIDGAEAVSEVQKPVLEQKARPWYIYILSDPRTDEVRYVGKTVSPRARYHDHMLGVRKNNPTPKYKWMIELKSENKHPKMTIIDSGTGISWVDAEKRWIRFFLAVGFSLTNVANGGEGQSAEDGRKHPKPMSAETREKISKALTGKPLSDEHKEKCRRAMLGKKHSDETRKKMSESHTGVKRGPFPEWWVEKLRTCPRKKRSTPMSEQERENRSRGQKNRKPITEETRAKQSAAQKAKGRVMSQEEKDNLSRKLSGVKKPPRTAEHCAKISAAKKGKKKATNLGLI